MLDEDLAAAVHHGGGRLVAGGLDAEHDHDGCDYRASWETGTSRSPRASHRGTYSFKSLTVNG